MTKISDYKIVAHGSVFLLMAQNEAASLNLIENYENSNFNKNGGLIMLPEFLNDWIDHFQNNWIVSTK
tara:strand:+ start:98 stop:301 length:204 start_codon:yes stop_codon:yes gene_type:complete